MTSPDIHDAKGNVLRSVLRIENSYRKSLIINRAEPEDSNLGYCLLQQTPASKLLIFSGRAF